jgi:hypothetical protein
MPWGLRVLVAPVLLVVLLEAVLRVGAGPFSRLLSLVLGPVLRRYLPLREWALEHPVLAGVLGLVTVAVVAVLVRWWLLVWHNEVRARLTGTHLQAEVSGFPTLPVDVLRYVRERPKGTTFVGLRVEPSLFGWTGKPFFIDAKQRSMHTHVLGKTGSGKTASVIWPTVLQDVLDGKGVLVMDAKGSNENVKMMKGIAALAGRERELKVFALPAWNNPSVWSHTYNMAYVRPRSPGNAGGDPVAVAERIFSVMPLGDNEYYNTQAQIAFTNLFRILHAIVDERGFGKPFVLNDVACCLKGIGGVGGFAAALERCLAETTDKKSAAELQNQIARLDRDVQKTMSGIIGAVDKFSSPLVNAYAPDIIFEDVLQTNGIVYVQLPGNLFKIQGPAMGKVMLMDVQQEGSLRQVFRATRNQTPFTVAVDEFYNFADLSIIDSLNKLRDANLAFMLAHQSIADLELVSKEFAVGCWDNTRSKVILNQDNPELCEKVSKSIGTHQVIEKTVRQQQGALFTSLTTGDAGTKLVETFKLHPNAVKSLAACGQGYFYFGNDIVPLALGMLPNVAADYPLKANSQAGAKGLRLGDEAAAFKSPAELAAVAAVNAVVPLTGKKSSRTGCGCAPFEGTHCPLCGSPRADVQGV